MNQSELELALPGTGLAARKKTKERSQPKEYKVVSLRECVTPESLQVFDNPQQAADYWRLHIARHPYHNADCECLVVLMLNTRRRVKGHQLVSFGTMDTILVHPREVFRAAIIAAASAVVLVPAVIRARRKRTSKLPEI